MSDTLDLSLAILPELEGPRIRTDWRFKSVVDSPSFLSPHWQGGEILDYPLGLSLVPDKLGPDS